MHFLTTFLTLSITHAMLMDMDPGDPFTQACFSTVGNLYEFGSVCESDNWGVTSRNGRCPCPDDRFAETVVSCINQLVGNVTSEKQSHTRNVSLMAFKRKCPQHSLESLFEYSDKSSQLEGYDGNRTAIKPGSWPVTRAFAPSTEEISDAIKVYWKQRNQEDNNKRYGAGLVAFWAGVVLLRGIVHFSAHLFPMTFHRMHQMTMFRKWRQTIGLYYLGPASLTSFELMVLLAFFVLVIVFSFIDLGVWYPDNTTLYRNSATYGRAIGMRTGVLSLYILPLLILFAGRNNFLLWLTGWSQDTYLIFHRWIARSVVGLLLAHAIGYSINRAMRAPGSYAEVWKEKYWNVGIVGLTFAAFTAVQGIRYIRRRAYELFIILHIIAVIIFLAAGYHHLKILEEYIGLYFFYACFAVWGFDRAARLARVIYSGFVTYEYEKGLTRSFGKKALIQLEKDTLVITFDRPRGWKMLEKPGQFVYVHFLKWSLFWQSHPFTLTSSTQDPNQLKLFARVHRGITKTLADMTLNNGTVAKTSKTGEVICYEIEIKVLLDGPYGHSHDLFEYDELLFVAGGTGITAPFSYIQNNILRFPNGYQKVKLFWAVSNPGLESWFEEELRYLEEFKHIEVHIFISRNCDNPRKLRISESLGNAIYQAQGATCVLSCGPPSMNAEVKGTVANFVPKFPYYLQYYEESFSF